MLACFYLARGMKETVQKDCENYRKIVKVLNAEKLNYNWRTLSFDKRVKTRKLLGKSLMTLEPYTVS